MTDHVGTSGYLQPLDVQFNRTLRTMERHLRDFVVDVNLEKRGNTIKRMSLVYNQLCAPRLIVSHWYA